MKKLPFIEIRPRLNAGLVYPLVASWKEFDRETCKQCGRFVSEPDKNREPMVLRVVGVKNQPIMYCDGLLSLNILRDDLHQLLYRYAEPFFIFGPVRSMEGPDVECVYWRGIHPTLLYPIPHDPHLDAPEPCWGCPLPTVLNVKSYRISSDVYEQTRGVVSDSSGGLYLDPSKMDVDKVLSQFRRKICTAKCTFEISSIADQRGR